MNSGEWRNVVKPGMVLQIDPEQDETFGACFLQVTEVKTWGVQGFVRVPGGLGAAYVRKEWSCVEPVGLAVWIEANTAQEAES